MKTEILNQAFRLAGEGNALSGLEEIASAAEKLAARAFRAETEGVVPLSAVRAGRDLSHRLSAEDLRLPSNSLVPTDLEELGFSGKVAALRTGHVPVFHAQDGKPTIDVRSVIPGTEYSRIFQESKDAVIRIGSGEPIRAGAGYMVDHHLALTADHVIFDKATGELRPNMHARFSDGSKKLLQVTARAPENDLALVRILDGGNQYPHLSLASLNDLDEGERMYAIGNPNRVHKSVLTRGEYLDWGRNGTKTATFTAAMPVWRGFSGGPILRTDGTVAGTLTKGDETIAIGVASDHGLALINALKGETIDRGILMFNSKARVDFSGSRERLIVMPTRIEHTG